MNIIFIQYFSDLFASFSYVYVNAFQKCNKVFLSSMEVFAYSNIYILGIMLALSPIIKKKYGLNLLNIKHYLANSLIIRVTLLSVCAAYMKTILLSGQLYIFGYNINITQLELRSYAIISPFITVILCHFFLHDQKLNKSFVLSIILCTFGFIYFNSGIQYAVEISIVLIVYTIINGYSDFCLKKISKQRGVDMMLFDNLMFLFMSSIIFTIALFNENLTTKTLGIQKFDINKLTDINVVMHVFFVALLSFLAHNFKMLSFKGKHIAGIVIMGIFFKSINSIWMTYIEKNHLPNINQIIGISIMSFGLCIFLRKLKNI